MHEYAVGEKDWHQWQWITARGKLNVGVLVVLVMASLALFMVYPVIAFVSNNARHW